MTEETLSSFWRHRRSTDRPIALRDLQDELTYMARLILKDQNIQIAWHKDLLDPSKTEVRGSKTLILDSSPVDDLPNTEAIPDSRVDILVGDMTYRSHLEGLNRDAAFGVAQAEVDYAAGKNMDWATTPIFPRGQAAQLQRDTLKNLKDETDITRIFSLLKHLKAWSIGLNAAPAIQDYVKLAKTWKREQLVDVAQELCRRIDDAPYMEDIFDLFSLYLIYGSDLDLRNIDDSLEQAIVNAGRKAFILAGQDRPSSASILKAVSEIALMFKPWAKRPEPPAMPTPQDTDEDNDEDEGEGQDDENDGEGQTSPNGTEKENEGEEPEGGPGEDESEGDDDQDDDGLDTDDESRDDRDETEGEKDSGDPEGGETSPGGSDDNRDSTPDEVDDVDVPDLEEDDGEGVDNEDGEGEEEDDGLSDQDDKEDNSGEEPGGLESEADDEVDRDAEPETQEPVSPETQDLLNQAQDRPLLDLVDQMSTIPEEDVAEIRDSIDFAREDISDEVDVTGDGATGGGPTIIWEKAPYDAKLEADLRTEAYQTAQGITEILRKFKRMRSRVEHAQETGHKLDKRRLGRVLYGDSGVWQKRSVIDKLDMSLSILLDASGSVAPDQWDLMVKVGAAFMQAAIGRDDVEMVVESYSTWGEKVNIDRHYDRKLGKYHAKRMTDFYGTPSAIAIAALRDSILKRLGVRHRDKIIVHVTDGVPNESVKAQVEACRKAGIEVFCVLVGDALEWIGMDYINSMFGDFETPEDFFLSEYGKGKFVYIREYKDLLKGLTNLFGSIVEVR